MSNRRVRRIASQREAELERMVNDLSKNDPLSRYTRDDLIECIKWQAGRLCAAAVDKSNLRLDILAVLHKDMWSTAHRAAKKGGRS